MCEFENEDIHLGGETPHWRSKWFTNGISLFKQFFVVVRNVQHGVYFNKCTSLKHFLAFILKLNRVFFSIKLHLALHKTYTLHQQMSW